MEFKECSVCANEPGIIDLCESCINNRDLINELKQEIEAENRLLAERNRLLYSIPECPVHGNTCVPHAIEWVNRVKTLGKIIFREM